MEQNPFDAEGPFAEFTRVWSGQPAPDLSSYDSPFEGVMYRFWHGPGETMYFWGYVDELETPTPAPAFNFGHDEPFDYAEPTSWELG